MPLHGPINLESVLKSSVYSTHRLQSWIIIDSSCSKIGQVVYKNSSQYKDDGFSSIRTLLRLNQRDSQSFVLILVLPKHLEESDRSERHSMEFLNMENSVELCT